MNKPFYDDVNGSTAKFLPLINAYVVELEANIIEQNKEIKELEAKIESVESLYKGKRPESYIQLYQIEQALNPEKNE